MSSYDWGGIHPARRWISASTANFATHLVDPSPSSGYATWTINVVPRVIYARCPRAVTSASNGQGCPITSPIVPTGRPGGDIAIGKKSRQKRAPKMQRPKLRWSRAVGWRFFFLSSRGACGWFISTVWIEWSEPAGALTRTNLPRCATRRGIWIQRASSPIGKKALCPTRRPPTTPVKLASSLRPLLHPATPPHHPGVFHENPLARLSLLPQTSRVHTFLSLRLQDPSDVTLGYITFLSRQCTVQSKLMQFNRPKILIVFIYFYLVFISSLTFSQLHFKLNLITFWNVYFIWKCKFRCWVELKFWPLLFCFEMKFMVVILS